MELSIKQIIYAVLTILFIVVVVLFGPSTIRQIAHALNLNIGLEPGELETQVEAKDIADELIVNLNSCVNPGELDRPSCFCLKNQLDLPTGYSLKFLNDGENINMDLISDRSYKLKEYKINRANAASCSLAKNKCFSDFEDGIKLIRSPNWVIEFNSSDISVKDELDDKYVFYYSFDSEKRKVLLLLASKRFAYDQIRKNTTICGENSNIGYTKEMEWYLIQQLYK